MFKITEAINRVLGVASEQCTAITNKVVMAVGVGGSSAGVASGIAKNTTELSSGFLTLAELGSVCGIIGGITLAVKLMFDVYFGIKKDKREQEIHKIKLKEGE